MLTALMSDIHGNREAFEACLADAERRGAGRHIFLGDFVGYGADPVWVSRTAASLVARGAVALRGNHDDAVLRSAADMNESARLAIEWTRAALGAAEREFLSALPLAHEEGERYFVHASARTPERWPYVTGWMEAAASMAATPHRLTFCGHTHTPQLYAQRADGIVSAFTPAAGAAAPLAPPRRWLAVLGAVGQPRDGDPAAAYSLLSDRNELTLIRVPYDVAAAARKIRAAGLPPRLADRLFKGW